MKRLLVFIPGILFFLCVSAQKCPTISVKGPYTVTAGDNLNLIAEVKGGDANASLTYNWSISNGSISSGQGTSSITIDSKGLEGSITATLELGGISRECASTSSMTVDIIPAPKLILSANYTTAKALTASVQKLIKDADMKNPQNNNIAFIYLYKGAKTTPAQYTQMKTAMNNALQKNGILSYQYKIADGGKKKIASFDMYSMAPDATTPVAK